MRGLVGHQASVDWVNVQGTERGLSKKKVGGIKGGRVLSPGRRNLKLDWPLPFIDVYRFAKEEPIPRTIPQKIYTFRLPGKRQSKGFKYVAPSIAWNQVTGLIDIFWLSPRNHFFSGKRLVICIFSILICGTQHTVEKKKHLFVDISGATKVETELTIIRSKENPGNKMWSNLVAVNSLPKPTLAAIADQL